MSKDLNKQIKEFIKKTPFFQKMFSFYGVPLESINKVDFQIKKIDGRNGQSDSKSIILHEKLFKDDFFKNNVHFLVHEIGHWLQRQKEDKCYFSDPEEVDSFKLGICYELCRGKKLREIAEVFYPIIADHFEKEEDGIKMFMCLYEKGLEEVEKYK